MKKRNRVRTTSRERELEAQLAAERERNDRQNKIIIEAQNEHNAVAEHWNNALLALRKGMEDAEARHNVAMQDARASYDVEVTHLRKQLTEQIDRAYANADAYTEKLDKLNKQIDRLKIMVTGRTAVIDALGMGMTMAAAIVDDGKAP